jgi:hypothetical protein
MNDPRTVEGQVARLARVHDDDLHRVATGPAARALLAAVLDTAVEPPPARRWLRLPQRPVGRARPVRRLALAVCLLGWPGNASSYANSAIAINREGDFFVARIKDPLADSAKFSEAFRAVGKDVDLELVPVSQRFVGQRIRADGGSGRMSSEMVGSGPAAVDCAVDPASCTLVIRISTETTGTVRYTVGRAARPGEQVRDPAAGVGGPPPTGTARPGR